MPSLASEKLHSLTIVIRYKFQLYLKFIVRYRTFIVVISYIFNASGLRPKMIVPEISSILCADGIHNTLLVTLYRFHRYAPVLALQAQK